MALKVLEESNNYEPTYFLYDPELKISSEALTSIGYNKLFKFLDSKTGTSVEIKSVTAKNQTYKDREFKYYRTNETFAVQSLFWCI